MPVRGAPRGANDAAGRAARALVLAAACALGVSAVAAGDEGPAVPGQPAAAQPGGSSTGLPSLPGLEWRFHLEATFGAFGFADSLYADPNPDEPSGDLGDDWLEAAAKPGLSATYAIPGGGQLYGKLSAAGERTFGAAPSAVGEDASSFQVDDLYVGWRSGELLPGLGDDALDVTIGRAPYQLGHGFLVYDGAAEGGSRGGYWTNIRKAFAFAAVGRFRAGAHTAEAFYLVRDELPEAKTGTRLGGVNYELALGEATTLGATILRASAHADARPTRDGLDVFDVRAFTAPIPALPGLSFELEYAHEMNGALLESSAFTAQAACTLDVPWRPRLSYRYAWFQGDDPGTSRSEAFDPLFPGFHDWGTWWQGEIAGEYFLSNSNLVSHQVRLHAEPSESLGTGLILYRFLADQPGALGAGVTSKDLAVELDAYADWRLDDHFTLSPVVAWASPGEAVEQAFGRKKDFWYGMLFLAYAY